MSQADRDAAAAMVATWRSREAVKRANAKARNDLEAYVINTREALEENEALRQVGTKSNEISKIALNMTCIKRLADVSLDGVPQFAPKDARLIVNCQLEPLDGANVLQEHNAALRLA